MLRLKGSLPDEIAKMIALESESDARSFIIAYSAEKHLEEMQKSDVIYLSIYNGELFLGFIILVKDDNQSVEFKRIVVAQKGKGIGQLAIKLMEQYCKENLNARRIWLDVFAANLRGQHIYKKMGFQQTGADEINGETILFFEKNLSN